MNNARKLIRYYRRFLYVLFGRCKEGLITDYVECSIIGDIEINKKDCVHPCVRYSEKPFRGYHWWMVYTPYYKANAALENPILCYGEGNAEPPSDWYVYKELKPQPEVGYNSDPNMLIDGDTMYIYWRENETKRLLQSGLHRGTFCLKMTESDSWESAIPVLSEALPFEDHEVSPTFIKYKGQDLVFSNHLLFKSPCLQKISGRIKLLIDKFLLATDLLGIYAQQKSYGIAVHKGG